MTTPQTPLIFAAVAFAAACLLPSLTAAPAATAPAPAGVTVHVAPNGNDRAPGTVDRPLQTLAAAQARVRKMPRTGPITVHLAPGTYRLEETLRFTSEDSGTQAAPITWLGAGWRETVVSGGKPITGWRRSETHPQLWQASVPKGTRFNQLWVDGKRAVRARTPNTDYLYIDTPGTYRRATQPGGRPESQHQLLDDGFVYRAADAAAWTDAARNAPEAMAVVFHCWTASLHWMKDIQQEKNRVIFRNQPHSINLPFGTWGLRGKHEKTLRYVLENYREALDSPGEWFLDPAAGLVWYWPRQGENPATTEAIFPVLDEIVRLEPSAAGRPISHLRFKGISFQHQEWGFDRDARIDGQAFSWTMPAGIKAYGLVHSSFEDCEIAHVGTHALWLEEGCQDNRVSRCHIHDAGGGGVYIGPSGDAARLEAVALVSSPEAAKVQRNVVDNCYIHDITHLLRGAIGIWVGCAAYNQLTHNEISDFDYTGISVGWTWTRRKDLFLHSNLVEYNHIHHTTKEILSDNGGVYVMGWAPESVVARNLIHDIHHYPNNDFARAIYLDADASCYRIEQNICSRLKSLGMHIKGENNLVRDNVFADATRSAIMRDFRAGARDFEYNVNTFHRNIYYLPNRNMLEGYNSLRWAHHHGNLYWSTGHGKDVRFFDRSKVHDPAALSLYDITFEQWQALGRDANSIVADPLFVDPAQGDFRLKEGSPALQLGFQQWDHAKAGLYGDAEWTNLPKAYPIPPIVLSPRMLEASNVQELPFR